MYARARDIIRDVAEIVRPPRRLTVPQASEQHIILDTPGGYSGPWRNDLVYYLVEPAECLTSRDYQAVIFVGPAQTGKTNMLVDNWAAHTITCDPADHMIVQTAQDTARDYSKRRVDRMIDSSPDIKSKLKPGGSNNNTYDKYFRSGMILSLGWPTKNQLAGKAIGKMALTDYDRMPENIDGEGAAFFLSMKRTTTFLSRGMTLAESSPSKPILDNKWKPTTAHEAPPTKGVLGLYNTGDKRRLYGQCPHCAEYFTPDPGIDAVSIPSQTDMAKAASEAGLICQKCGVIITQEFEKRFKKSGVWLKEGQRIDKHGVITGDYVSSKRASFWLPGWFAAFQSWQSIVLNYLYAKDIFDRTGDEESLKNTVNLDQGAPYLPKNLENKRDPHELEQRAEKVKKRTVPDGVRFLLASVDVQKGWFAVQVEGFGEYLESWVIDRFNLRISYRNDDQGNPLKLDPASYIEDWDVLIDNVIDKTYPLESGLGSMPIFKIACDSGGEDGVTDNAYKFWRKMYQKGYSSKHFINSRFSLVKGQSNKNSPIIRESFPDTTKRKDSKTNVAGDVPVYLLNTDLLKDIVANQIERKELGAGFIHFPSWLDTKYFQELTSETRTDKGWKNKSRRRNEPFDLMAYNRALIKLLKADSINWSDPPIWAMTSVRREEVEKEEAKQMIRDANKTNSDDWLNIDGDWI